MKTLKRRDLLKSSLAVAGASAIPTFFSNQAAAQVATTGRMVFVFLRGGADPLSMVIPVAGATLTALTSARANILPTAANQVGLVPGALNLHGFMNPLVADATLKSNLNFVLHSGSPYDSRSHFEQMARIESGDFATLRTDGFLARISNALGRSSFAIAPVIPASMRGSNPLVMTTPDKLKNQYVDPSAGKDWRFGSAYSRATRLGMYKIGAGETGDAVVNQMANVAQAQYDLIESAGVPPTLAQLMAGGHGYTNTALGQRLATAAYAMTTRANPAMISVDAENVWDSHANQNTNDNVKTTALGYRLQELATNLAAFKKDLVLRGLWATTTVVVVSEFGRTIKQNGALGSDHGRGGLMMLMGGRVRPITSTLYTGPRAWTLPTGVLNSSSALDVQIDLRIVLHEILQKGCGVAAATANAALPGISTTQWKGVIA